MHRSTQADLHHHQHESVLLFIQNYPSAFFFTTRFGLAATGSTDTFVFFVALRVRRALMAFLFRDTPKELFWRFPFFDFLSPFPIAFFFLAQ